VSSTSISRPWHPHIHTLVTCGAFTPQGGFLELPELDMDRLHAVWREAVFALYLAEGKIGPEVVENMRSWPHSGFHVDQSAYLAADDRAGVERVTRYMVRCPFSLARLIKVTESRDVYTSPPVKANSFWSLPACHHSPMEYKSFPPRTKIRLPLKVGVPPEPAPSEFVPTTVA
jgi:hypothetical protein